MGAQLLPENVHVSLRSRAFSPPNKTISLDAESYTISWASRPAGSIVGKI
jgi:hypothetical protein